jgi:hypothetical protein
VRRRNAYPFPLLMIIGFSRESFGMSGGGDGQPGPAKLAPDQQRLYALVDIRGVDCRPPQLRARRPIPPKLRAPFLSRSLR